MFTSRAEHRLLLREDNADLRLTPKGRELGLVDDARWRVFCERREAIESELARLGGILVRPGDVCGSEGEEILGGPLTKETPALELLRRPELDYSALTSLSAVGGRELLPDAAEESREQVGLQVEVQAKYRGYIERQQREIERRAGQEALRLPADLDYSAVHGLSNEARQKLDAARPETVGQASRLEGVTPAAVSLLLIHMKKRLAGRTAAAGPARARAGAE